MNDGSQEEHSEVDAGSVAHKAIKKHFPKACTAVMKGDIPDRLYADSLLDEDMVDVAFNPTLTEKQKGRKLVRHLQDVVRLDHKKFCVLCEIFSQDILTKDLSTALKGEFVLHFSSSQEMT